MPNRLAIVGLAAATVGPCLAQSVQPPLFVRDLELSVRWYGEAAGLTEAAGRQTDTDTVRRLVDRAGEVVVVLRTCGEPEKVFRDMGSEAREMGCASGAVSLFANDVDGLERRLAGAGLRPDQVAGIGDGSCLRVSDPDGNAVRFFDREAC